MAFWSHSGLIGRIGLGYLIFLILPAVQVALGIRSCCVALECRDAYLYHETNGLFLKIFPLRYFHLRFGATTVTYRKINPII
jgi:hypothetical protein